SASGWHARSSPPIDLGGPAPGTVSERLIARLPRRQVMANYDSPWKEALDEQLPLFLALLAPEVEQDLDWTQDFESLDAELLQLTGKAETGRRLADRLIKARTRAGEDRYLHAEVQAQPQPDFEHRLFVYQYRGDDRFGLPLEAI